MTESFFEPSYYSRGVPVDKDTFWLLYPQQFQFYHEWPQFYFEESKMTILNLACGCQVDNRALSSSCYVGGGITTFDPHCITHVDPKKIGNPTTPRGHIYTLTSKHGAFVRVFSTLILAENYAASLGFIRSRSIHDNLGDYYLWMHPSKDREYRIGVCIVDTPGTNVKL